MYITTGSGKIIGTGYLRLLGHNSKAVLVLGPDNAIHGSATIWPQVVNYGLIDPNDPVSGLTPYPHTIKLLCEPKIGPGDWQVTGGGSEQGQENKMEVWTPIAGTGDLTVGEHGVLLVHRHLSLYGQFFMDKGARIEVDEETVFDVHRFSPASCPE